MQTDILGVLSYIAFAKPQDARSVRVYMSPLFRISRAAPFRRAGACVANRRGQRHFFE
jgi:hypothetical protein